MASDQPADRPVVTRPPLPLWIGQDYRLNPGDIAYATAIGTQQAGYSKDRGSRDGGDDPEKRILGCIGESAVAGMLDIPSQIRALPTGPDLEPDIVHAGYVIEVKAGLPLVWRRATRKYKGLRPEALYVAVKVRGDLAVVQYLAWGADIKAADWLPPPYACPRPGTRALNYWFGGPDAGDPETRDRLPLPDPGEAWFLHFHPEPEPVPFTASAAPSAGATRPVVTPCPILGWVWDYPGKPRHRCPGCDGPGRVRKGAVLAEHRPAGPPTPPGETSGG